ncbi:hypothetical protein J6590_043755 [Homalodisca vitripennis]|nr:hypothetical protein J6590_043755 [Homalodisca vitripennis]
MAFLNPCLRRSNRHYDVLSERIDHYRRIKTASGQAERGRKVSSERHGNSVGGQGGPPRRQIWQHCRRARRAGPSIERTVRARSDISRSVRRGTSVPAANL